MYATLIIKAKFNSSQVWAKIRMRLCQFHVIQAIRRWDRDHGRRRKKRRTRKPKGTKSKRRKGKKTTAQNTSNPNSETSEDDGSDDHVSLPKGAMTSLLDLFRHLQRCRADDKDPFEPAVQSFESELADLCTAHRVNDTMLTAIKKYFRENWFIEEWRGSCSSL
jgi:hypothetical protein